MEYAKAGISNAEAWRSEAKAVIDDVKGHVKSIELSEKLLGSDRRLYFNLTTLEDLDYCVELSPAGFTVVDTRHDANSNPTNDIFETPYSLLESVSPNYVESFGTQLLNKLKNLQEDSQ